MFIKYLSNACDGPGTELFLKYIFFHLILPQLCETLSPLYHRQGNSGRENFKQRIEVPTPGNFSLLLTTLS